MKYKWIFRININSRPTTFLIHMRCYSFWGIISNAKSSSPITIKLPNRSIRHTRMRFEAHLKPLDKCSLYCYSFLNDLMSKSRSTLKAAFNVLLAHITATFCSKYASSIRGLLKTYKVASFSKSNRCCLYVCVPDRITSIHVCLSQMLYWEYVCAGSIDKSSCIICCSFCVYVR